MHLSQNYSIFDLEHYLIYSKLEVIRSRTTSKVILNMQRYQHSYVLWSTEVIDGSVRNFIRAKQQQQQQQQQSIFAASYGGDCAMFGSCCHMYRGSLKQL